MKFFTRLQIYNAINSGKNCKYCCCDCMKKNYPMKELKSPENKKITK